MIVRISKSLRKWQESEIATYWAQRSVQFNKGRGLVSPVEISRVKAKVDNNKLSNDWQLCRRGLFGTVYSATRHVTAFRPMKSAHRSSSHDKDT